MLCHFSHQLPKHHLEEKSPSETDQQRHVGRSALNELMRLFNRTWGDRFVARWAAVDRAFPRPEYSGYPIQVSPLTLQSWEACSIFFPNANVLKISYFKWHYRMGISPRHLTELSVNISCILPSSRRSQ